MSAYTHLALSFIFRGLRSEKARALLTIAGVVLGVAVLIAVRLANRSSLEVFSDSVSAVSGSVSLEISNPSGAFDESLLSGLNWLDDFGTWSPVISRSILVPDGGTGTSGAPTGRVLQVLGTDLLTDWPLRGYRTLQLDSGTTPSPSAILSLLSEPGTVIVSAKLSQQLDLSIGSTFSTLSGDHQIDLRVRGILEDSGPAKGADGNFLLADITTAQDVFRATGTIDRIDLRLHPHLELTASRQQIAARLPTPLALSDPGDRVAQARTMVRSFHFNLTALASLALVVGLFLIYNTASFSVVRRRHEIGRLRAIGTSRPLVFALFLTEAAVLAIPGVTIGALAGQTLAASAVAATAGTVDLFFVADAASASASALSLGPAEWILALAVALPLCLAAAALPAYEATKTPPGDSLDAAPPPERPRIPLRLASVAGLLLAAFGLCLLPAVSGIPVFACTAVALTITAASLLVPPLLSLTCTLARRIFSSSTTVSLAAANLSSAAGRLSVSVAALAVALGMTVAIAVLIGSFRDTVSLWLRSSLTGDLFVRPASAASSLNAATIGPDAIAIIASAPGIASVDTLTKQPILYQGAPVTLAATDFSAAATHGRFTLKAPRSRSAEEVLASAPLAATALVSEPFSLHFGVSVGSAIELPSSSGKAVFNVAGIYFDYSDTRGVILIDRSSFREKFAPPSGVSTAPSSLIAFTSAGADPAQVRAFLEGSLTANGYRLVINTTRGVLDASMEIFDATFAITRALQLIAVIVAALGIVATLVTLLLERRREIALLKLIGTGTAQIRRIIVTEAVLVASTALALGAVLGTCLSLILVYVINVQSFGWTIQFAYPWLWVAQLSILVLLGAAVAALWPARSASRILPTHL